MGEHRPAPEAMASPPATEASTASGWGGLAFAAALVALALAVYQPAWHGGFLFDDPTLVAENPLIKAADGLYRFWFTTDPPDYFPLTSTTWWIEWRVWGADPTGYHVVNILLHAVSGWLLWRLLRELKIPGAWLAAVLFVVHPVNVESVAWISERKNALALPLFLGSLLAYLRYDDRRQPGWLLLSWLLYALSLLSKTAGVLLPVVLWGIGWWRRGRVTWNDVRQTLPFFALGGLLAMVGIWFQSHRATSFMVARSDGFLSRCIGAGWATWFYLGKALLPIHLSPLYPRWVIDPAAWWAYLPGAACLILLAVFWTARNAWGRPWLAALAFFLAMLFPVLGFFNIYWMRYSLVADHWQYFAILAPITLAAALLSLRARLWPIGCTLAAVLAVLTWQQSGAYRDEATFFRTILAENPSCWMAHNNLGKILAAGGHDADAISHFEQALALNPACYEAHTNLGNALLRRGAAEEALRHYAQALAYAPHDANAHTDLGKALAQRGQLDAALEHYQAAVAADSGCGMAYNNIGLILAGRGRFAEAVAMYRRALACNAEEPLFECNLGQALASQGAVAEGLEHYRRAVALRPTSAAQHQMLGQALLAAGRGDEAVAAFRQALQLDPRFAPAHYSLGNALARQNQFQAAIASYSQAIACQPDDAKAYIKRGIAQACCGRMQEAIADFQAALKIDPHNAAARENLQQALARRDQQPLSSQVPPAPR